MLPQVLSSYMVLELTHLPKGIVPEELASRRFILSGRYVTPLSIQKETDLLFLPITESGDPCKQDTKETWWQSLFGILVPSAGVYVNRDMLRNLSATIGQMVEETAKSTAAQQKSLDSLAQVVLDNRIALDLLLPKQGGVCAIGHTCYTYVSTSGEVETHPEKIFRRAKWLQDVRKSDPLSQRSPIFLAPGTGFMEDSFSVDRGGGREVWFRR